MLATLLLGLAVVAIGAAASARIVFGGRAGVTVTALDSPDAQGTRRPAGAGPQPAATLSGPTRAGPVDRRVNVTAFERARAALGLALLTAAVAAAASVVLGAAMFVIGLLIQKSL